MKSRKWWRRRHKAEWHSQFNPFTSEGNINYDWYVSKIARAYQIPKEMLAPVRNKQEHASSSAIVTAQAYETMRNVAYAPEGYYKGDKTVITSFSIVPVEKSIYKKDAPTD